MKKLFSTLSFLFLSTLLFAQADTTTIEVTLKARHHAYIVSLMGGRGEVHKVRYSTQVANQLTLPVDTAQLITVEVPISLVKELYMEIGGQSERLAAIYNEEIKQALLPQIMQYPDLIAAIMVIAQQNAVETNGIVNAGLAYLTGIKQ